ncbi:MAG TPA: peptidoglycan-binding domain-containing protein [Caldimonas sp.]|nr:peptidoglycan-binding domain-containing protein [Caldimonas sp.]
MKSRRFSSDRQLLDVEANKIVLKNGGKGTGVAKVQAFLHLVGNRLPKSIKQGQPDGIFGPETESFVKKFQAQAGVKADGIVGRITLAAMDQVLVDKPVLDTASPSDYGTAVLAGSGRRLGDRPVYFV